MTTISDLCEAYGFSKSTALRRVKDCFGDAPKQGNVVHLDASQTQVFADYLAKLGFAPTRQSEPQDAPHDAEAAAQLAEAQAALVRQYEERIRDLQAEIERLHAVLEREQARPRGFWDRLGQKLLGSGKD